MVDSKFFGIPFATSGDKVVIPEDVQPSGAISYQQGYGPDYERDPETDPLAKRVPRDETNELYYQITNSLKFIQLYGTPEWYAVDDNGDPVSYPINAQVHHDAGSGTLVWRSLVAANTTTPGSDPTKWAVVEIFSVASDAEVQAGIETGKIVSPAGLSSRTATQTRTGLVELATAAEVSAGVDAARVPAIAELAPAVRKNPWAFAAAGGTANALTLSLTPAPASLADLVGAEIRVQIGQDNTGAATLNVNGLGVKNIVNSDLSPLLARALIAGQISRFIYDGTQFQAVGTPYEPGAFLNVQVFSASGTYTPSFGAQKILVEVVGAGGGGAGARATTTDHYAGGGGGGGGGYASSLLSNPAVTAVTIGAGGTGGSNTASGSIGGTSSFGALLSATGGLGGGGTEAAEYAGGEVVQQEGGTGGVGSGGNIVNARGQKGGNLLLTRLNNCIAGNGGGSRFSFGPDGKAGLSGNGIAGTLGAGGSGALSQSSAPTFYSGGNGGAGLVIVWEYS